MIRLLQRRLKVVLDRARVSGEKVSRGGGVKGRGLTALLGFDGSWPRWVKAVVATCLCLGLGIVVLIVVGVVFAAFTFAQVASRDDQSRHWAEFTGPIGDTFGGTLGPLLNALVLAATVWIAIFVQPAQVQRDRTDTEAREDGLRIRLEEENRAAEVVAWIAETEDQRYVGVVVTNGADSVVHNVDIEVDASNADDALDIDRETVVPPGTWFIPFKAVQGDLGETVEGDLGWRLPVPVRQTDGMEVSLERLDTKNSESVAVLFLRPHLPGEHGEALTYYRLSEFRYELHRTAWRRSDGGKAERADMLTDDEERRRNTVVGTVRSSSRIETASRRVGTDVERLIQYTFDEFCEPAALSAARDSRAKNPLRGPFAVREGALPGVESLERPTNGGRVQFNLSDPSDAHLWMAQVNDSYPATVRLRGPNDLRFKIDGKRADGQVMKAGAEARRLPHAYQLPRPAGDWLKTAESRQEWLTAVGKMVDRAASALPVAVDGGTPEMDDDFTV